MQARFLEMVGRVLAFVVIMAFIPVAPVTVTYGWEGKDGDIPVDIREELERVLEKKGNDLYEKKDEDGLRFQRGTYSKSFTRVGDAYRVAYTIDTADKGKLKTERFKLILEKGSSGEWEITDEVLEDNYEKMIREMPGDETFHTFSSVDIDAEGLKVSAHDGVMIHDYLDGKLNWILFSSDDLAYDYAPPDDLPYNQAAVYRHLKERHEEDFVFNPELVLIDCDNASCDRILESSFTGIQESSRESMSSNVMKFYTDAEQEQRKDRQERVFSGFRLPYDPGRELYRIMVKRNGKDQWLGLNYDSEQAWEVQFFASEYGPLYGYISEEARKEGVLPYDVEQREDADSKDFELQGLRGTVEVAVVDSEFLSADLEYVMNVKRDCNEIKFSLGSFKGFGGKKISERHPSLTIDSLRLGDGQDLSWVLTGPSSGYVIFPEEVKAGTQLNLKMSYTNRGSIIKFSPSYSYMDRGGWLPFVRFTDRIDDFALTVRAPSKYTVLGIGTKVSEETDGDVSVTHWKANSPVAFPTIIFGDYYVYEPKIHAEKSDGTPIPVRIYADKDGMADRGIRGKQLKPLAEQAVNSLNLYREIYGMDYPYGKLDLVSDPVGVIGALYGQAPSSLIFLGWGVFMGEGRMGVATGEARLTKFLRTVVSHEVGHQWWGHMISHANNRNYWFIETFTEYASGLYVEAVNSDSGKDPQKGWEAYLDKVGQWRQAVMDTDLITSIQDSTALYGGEGGGNYIAAVYNKGPYALHILRMTFGMEKMNQFLRELMTEFADKEIIARDIQRVAERVYGGNMDWFFDQWIRGVGIPQYSFNYEYRKTEDGNYLVEGTVKQRVLVGTKMKELEGVFFRGAVPITVVGRDSQEYPVRLIIEGETTPFRFKVPVEPKEIALNKYGEILAYDVLENRGW